MSDLLLQADDTRSLDRHGWVVLLSVFGLFGGLVWWASTVEIAGAVVASGQIVVESYPKRIQHREGGIVAQLLVNNEDAVREGQVLLRLDATDTLAGISVLRSQWREALVREARLLAEINGKPDFMIPPQLNDQAGDAEISSLVATEKLVFAARTTAKLGRTSQLAEQIVQLETQIDGLKMQQEAIQQQLAILVDEIAKLQQLRAGGLVEASRVTALLKQQIELEGQRGQVISNSAGGKAAVAERRLQMAQLDDDFLSAALEQLQTARRTIADTGEQVRALQDRLLRAEIRAPQAGIVHESIVHTVGGVVAAGETLMQIVPQNDELMVTLRVSPMDVDRVSVGQETTLRLSSLDLRETPEITAAVISVAPNVTQDPATGGQYFSARVAIPDAELATLPNPGQVTPGMPVEAFLKTDEKTVLLYLVQPFIDQMRKAMRE